MTKNAAAPIEAPGRKTSRHVAIATRHLLAQREKAIIVRDRAGAEVDELNEALTALGWIEE